MTKKVYTRNDIDRLFSEKVAELMAEGRIINLDTMRGIYSRELGHVDFKDGEHTIRVWMVEEDFESEDYRRLVRGVTVMVKRYDSISREMWLEEGETTYSRTFYVVNSCGWYSSGDKGNRYVDTIEEAWEALKIRKERRRNRYEEQNVWLDCIKNKERIVKLVRGHKGYGRIKAEDIYEVIKRRNEYDDSVSYEIRFRANKNSLYIAG